MDNVYIMKSDLNKWIVKHLPQHQDMYSISDLVGAIEDMDSEIERLVDEIDRLKEYLGYDEHSKINYYDEESERELEVLGDD